MSVFDGLKGAYAVRFLKRKHFEEKKRAWDIYVHVNGLKLSVKIYDEVEIIKVMCDHVRGMNLGRRWRRNACLAKPARNSTDLDYRRGFTLLQFSLATGVGGILDYAVINPWEERDQLVVHLNLAKKESLSILSKFFKNFYVTQQSNHSVLSVRAP